jgi:hypothetical protein
LILGIPIDWFFHPQIQINIWNQPSKQATRIFRQQIYFFWLRVNRAQINSKKWFMQHHNFSIMKIVFCESLRCIFNVGWFFT